MSEDTASALSWACCLCTSMGPCFVLSEEEGDLWSLLVGIRTGSMESR